MADENSQRDPNNVLNNEKNIRIKQENIDSLTYDDDDDDEILTNSQIIDDSQDSQYILPGQQFFQQLDNALANLTKDQYIKELQSLCHNDEKRISLYREHMHAKAGSSNGYPNQKLISRKNTSKAKKAEKYAQDCYVICRFIQGERSSDIYDIFCPRQQGDNSIIVISDSQQASPDSLQSSSLLKPDTVTMITQIRDDVATIMVQQKRDAETLNRLSRKVDSITTVQSHILSSVNGIRSNQPACDPEGYSSMLGATLKGLSSAIEDIRSAINGVNRNPNINATTQDQDTFAGDRGDNHARKGDTHRPTSAANAQDKDTTRSEPLAIDEIDQSVHISTSVQSEDSHSTPKSSSPPGVEIVAINKRVTFNSSVDETQKRYSEIVRSNSENNSLSNNHNNEIQGQAKSPNHSQTSQNNTFEKQVENKDPAGKFIAVTRRRIATFHVSNIDPDVTETDIHDFLKSKDIVPKQIEMFYHGYRSASAKVVLSAVCAQIVEEDDFWPEEIVARKWKSKTEWENEIREKQSKYTTAHSYQYKDHDSDKHYRQNQVSKYNETEDSYNYRRNDSVRRNRQTEDEEYIDVDDYDSNYQYSSDRGSNRGRYTDGKRSGWGHEESWNSDDRSQWYNSKP